MVEELKVSGVHNPEYPLIRDYVVDAFLEEREGKPLGSSLKRFAGFVARYIAVMSSMVPSAQEGELADLDKVIYRSRGKGEGFFNRAGVSYSIRVENQAKRLLPGWMEVRDIARLSLHEKTDVAEQRADQLRRVIEDITRDNI